VENLAYIEAMIFQSVTQA